MKKNEVKMAKQKIQPISSCLDWTSSNNKGFVMLLCYNTSCLPRPCFGSLNLLSSKINMNTLVTVFYTFLMVLLERICSNIETFHLNDHFIHSNDLHINWSGSVIIRRNWILVTGKKAKLILQPSKNKVDNRWVLIFSICDSHII